jgi:subtilisin family serine protease
MDSDGLGDSFTLAEGIIEAVDSGASVISMSLGSYGYTRVLDDAVSYALSKGVALVASAGNDGANVVPYPAQFQGVIGVGAIDADSQRANFSNYSPSVDIAAPGVGVFAAWGDEEWISFSGTSAAAPYVSGSIAATLSLNPSLEPQEAADLLFQYADDGGAPGLDVETGNGTLNIDRVLSRDEPNIYDAAVCDFYLDYSQATASTIPLLVTVENRGTEQLNSVSMEIVQNGGFPQKVYLGRLLENETTAHTIYLDRAQLAPEFGYTIQAETIISGREDSRSENDAKSGSLVITTEEP